MPHNARGREGARWKEASGASFRVELASGLSEIVSCGRASTPYLPPNVMISSTSQFAEHSSTSGMLSVPMIGNVLEIEIFTAR